MKITIRNLQDKIPINPRKVKEVILKTLSVRGSKKSGEITVCFVNDKKIRELNLRFLNTDAPTDVISFNLSENKNRILGEIAVSTDTAIGNARIFLTTPIYETYLYVIHGLLHILGYDDKTVRQRNIMQKKAEKILCQFIKPRH